jgi:hypothetical protein
VNEDDVPVSQVVSPRSYAAFNSGNDSSSSITQGCHFDEPIDMAPRIGTETLRPLFPKRLYSALDSLRRPSTSSLSGIVAYVSIGGIVWSGRDCQDVWQRSAPTKALNVLIAAAGAHHAPDWGATTVELRCPTRILRLSPRWFDIAGG